MFFFYSSRDSNNNNENMNMNGKRLFRMINQLILAGSKYFNPTRSNTDEADSDLLSPPQDNAELMIEKLLQGDMTVDHVHPDIYLQLLQSIREKMSKETPAEFETVFANE